MKRASRSASRPSRRALIGAKARASAAAATKPKTIRGRMSGLPASARQQAPAAWAFVRCSRTRGQTAQAIWKPCHDFASRRFIERRPLRDLVAAATAADAQFRFRFEDADVDAGRGDHSVQPDGLMARSAARKAISASCWAAPARSPVWPPRYLWPRWAR